MVDEKIILEFVKKNDFLVLATASLSGKTEAAVMAYVAKDDFSILMYTEPETRKYKNLTVNKQVSLVIGGWENDPTVQIDGIARELDETEDSPAKNFVFSLHPEWQEHFSSVGKWFEVKPVWLRFSDFSQNPPEMMEIESFD